MILPNFLNKLSHEILEIKACLWGKVRLKDNIVVRAANSSRASPCLLVTG